MTAYNPKIDYLLAKFTDSAYAGALDEQEWKLVYREELEPQNDGQRFMLKTKRALAVVKAAIKLDYDTVGSICDRFGSARPDRPGVEAYLSTLADERVSVPARAFYRALKDRLFPDRGYETAVMIHTFFRLKAGLFPTVFFPLDGKELVKEIEGGASADRISDLIALTGFKTVHLNTPHELIGRDVLIERLLNLREILLRKFGVTSISFYGSYARGEETVYSDLDVYVEVDEERKKDPVNKYRLFRFLKKELGIAVDGRVRDDEYRELRVDMNRDLMSIY